VVLLAVGTWELVTILQHESPEDRPVGAVTAERPVQVDELTVRSVVDQAAQAAVAIGSASWEDYEAGIDAATAMMTDPFAEQYRETKADVKDQVVEQQVDVTVQVDAQGVVRADRTEIVALVFLTQSTIAGTGPVTPRQYRATVTMVNTADGWLVADLDAGDLLDITGDAG
jgi:Mce-associated membrane protein